MVTVLEMRSGVISLSTASTIAAADDDSKSVDDTIDRSVHLVFCSRATTLTLAESIARYETDKQLR